MRVIDETPGDVAQRGIHRDRAHMPCAERVELRGPREQQRDGNARVAHRAQFRAMKGRDDEVLVTPAALLHKLRDERAHRPGGAAAFQLDVDECAPVHRLENFAQCGDALALAGIERAELRESFA